MKIADKIRAILSAGGGNQAGLAKELGVTQPTVHRWLNGTEPEGPSRDAINRLFEKMVAAPGAAPARKPQERRHPTGIQEVDVRAGAGGGGVPAPMTDDFGNVIDAEGVKSVWSLPDDVTQGMMRAKPDHLRIFEVVGDSMEPRLNEGDRVFIDTRQTFPSPEGIFALWDGYGIVIKRVQLVRGSDPARVRVISANGSYPPYEADEEEIRIIGRYAGRFTLS